MIRMRLPGVAACRVLPICRCLSLLLAAVPAVFPQTKQTVLIIPHTHWEGAVFKTREEYLQIGLPHILKALYLLKKYPEYRFVLDQMAYVRPFLERYPSEAETFAEFVRQGRLQIAGGTDTMHDNNIPSGESIVRQYLFSKRYFREKLGYDVTTGWALDTFGHNPQMPQILKLAGMKSYWFQRGVPGPETPSEFLWQGIDGSQIPAFWLAISYAALHYIPGNETEFDEMVRSQVDRLTPFSRGRERVLLAGADVWEPEELLPVMLRKLGNAEPFSLRLGTPAEYESLVAKRSDRPVVSGELNPVFQGVYSSRIDVKQAMRSMESSLIASEKLSLLTGLMGGPLNSDKIERAWEPVLFNQAHDLSSGVMVDKVYDDSMQRYEEARRDAADIINGDAELLLSRIDTSGEGVPVVVFNTLSWPRSDFAETDVAFSEPGVKQFALLDATGTPIPLQLENILRNDDGGIRQARVGFMARDVPALGYQVYHAVPNLAGPKTADSEVHNSTLEDSGSIENEFFRASFNLWTGEMIGLGLKENGWQVLSRPGNVVAREYDGGDFWELYGTLNGARFTAMTKPILPPRPDYTQWSSDFVGGSGTISSGPVYSEFHISHPLGKNQFQTRVRMYQGLRRIDIRTELVNQEAFVRYRVVFPTTIHNGTAVHEIPFGALERKERQEFPAQNWVDYSDGKNGLALLNKGLPGNNVADGQMMLSLMRSARLISYGFIGGYEPGVGSDTGLGIGKKYTLEYGLVPHKGDWRTAEPWRAGLELNNPLLVWTAGSHPGVLPRRWGLLDVSAHDVVVSALKPAKDGSAVLRVYEAAGRPHERVTVNTRANVAEVHEANLMEDSGRALQVQGNKFEFDLKPYQIKTFKLRITGAFPPAGQSQ